MTVRLVFSDNREHLAGGLGAHFITVLYPCIWDRQGSKHFAIMLGSESEFFSSDDMALECLLTLSSNNTVTSYSSANSKSLEQGLADKCPVRTPSEAILIPSWKETFIY